jgi:hypothetical protein
VQEPLKILALGFGKQQCVKVVWPPGATLMKLLGPLAQQGCHRGDEASGHGDIQALGG